MGCQSSKGTRSIAPVLDSRSSYGHGKSGKAYVTFVSHFKMEAATDARLLQMELEKLFQRKVFLDSDDLKDLSQLTLHVTKDSDCLLLVQSAGVLTRPYCLLELYHAIESGIPIIGVSLRGQFSYDFALQEHFLLHLEKSLDEVNPGASDVLRDHGIDLLDCAYKLSSRVPKIISIEFNSCASRNILTATFNDIADNVRRSLSSNAKVHELPSKDDWMRERASKPWTGTQKAQMPGSRQHGASAPNEPRGMERASFKMAAGSGILQLAKSPVPGLAPVAFLLQAVTSAVDRAAHMRDDCDMFGCICEHIEQVLIEHGDKLRRHPERAELIKAISHVLSRGLTVIKPMAGADFDESTIDFATFPSLCGELHDVASRLEADVELLTPRKSAAASDTPAARSSDPAFTGAVFKQGGGADADAEAAAKKRQEETILQMRGELEKQQMATELEAEQTRAMELQNRLLEDRVKEMNALLGQVKPEEFMAQYPLPADEAERILTVQKYGLFELALPFSPVEDIVAKVCENPIMGSNLQVVFVSILSQSEQLVLVARIKTDDGTFLSFCDGMTDGFAASVGAENGLVIPKKLSACQYVVATGQLVCARKGAGREVDNRVHGMEQKMGHLPALMDVDAGFQAPGLPLMGAPQNITQDRERMLMLKMMQSLSQDNAMYAGAPIRVDGHTVGAFCATFSDAVGDVSPEQMESLHRGAEETAASFIAMHANNSGVAAAAAPSTEVTEAVAADGGGGGDEELRQAEGAAL